MFSLSNINILCNQVKQIHLWSLVSLITVAAWRLLNVFKIGDVN